MTTLANPRFHSLNGSSLKPVDQFIVNGSRRNLTLIPIHQRKGKFSAHRRPLTVQAAYSDDGKPNSAGIFIGGFVLGGMVVGALGCVYAPQISKVLTGADRKDLMRKLPKFIYDEEKALEKTRKILTEKIAQLNSAIDDVSSQLRADDASNGAVTSDEIEATI
ncbi:uncharacterized protein LOC122073113 [Macadamia integrifolia]|uniref:uncharacterized protein LOC122073113 n=1 Tax=Macadamia integrifolia TaxID=60698 RepID=UPI001C4FA3BB|nr:uncharacterized protein LOC122073113 [Macadamia integrifolia]